MKVRNYIYAAGLTIITLFSCNKDDDGDNEPTVIPPRDRAEQQKTDDAKLQAYFDTHFYVDVEVDLNNDGQIEYVTRQFDTIAGDNADKTPISETGLLETKTINRDGVEYKLYVLKIAGGATEKEKPTFADSTLVTYKGEELYDNEDRDADGIPNIADVDSDDDGNELASGASTRPDKDGDGIADNSDADDDGIDGLDAGKIDTDNDGIIDDKDPVDNNDLDRRVFDNRVSPVWFDQTTVIEGWRESLVDYRGASGFSENADGTVKYNDDYGNITVFIPSGLGYFNQPPVGITAYTPLVFNIQLYEVNQSDHDADGIPSYLEDIDNDRLLISDTDDNTDGDNFSDYSDADDDNDGTPTKNEITVVDSNNDGVITLDEITFYDDDGDGINNHLDSDDKEVKSE